MTRSVRPYRRRHHLGHTDNAGRRRARAPAVLPARRRRAGGMVRAQLTTRAASTPPHLTVRPTPGHLQPKASTGRGDTVVPARLSTKEGTGHAMTDAICTDLVIAEDG